MIDTRLEDLLKQINHGEEDGNLSLRWEREYVASMFDWLEAANCDRKITDWYHDNFPNIAKHSIPERVPILKETAMRRISEVKDTHIREIREIGQILLDRLRVLK